MTEPNKPLEQMTAQGRLDLGRSYLGESRFDKAIKALSSIRREEADPETYARAQLGLGVAYYAQSELDQAIEAWSNIHREEAAPETYAGAQKNLGVAYAKSGKWEQSIEALSSIRREEVDPETYAGAQLNLGVTYAESGELKQAIKTWSNIHREEAAPETYAKAQKNLGLAYKKQGKPNEAIKAWSNIRRSDDSKIYAQAQFNLGLAYKKQGKPNEAIKAWSNIRRSDDSKIYAQAQFNLGLAYKKQGKPNEAIKAWSNIRRSDDSKIYAQAQFSLGEIHKGKGENKQAKDAYRNVQGPLYYRAQREYRILDCPPDLINDLRSLARNTDKVREFLQIIPEFELKVAHYTRPQIAFDLFGDEKNDKKPSNFRLNTIRGVNDPTEGLVLNDYWDQQGIPETIHTNDTATFISCFTFNHDNLNQFRLYGKENGREATGVSLVFKKEFFSDQPDTLGFIAGPSTDLSSKSEQIKLDETGKMENDNKKPLIGKSTLYRCIYLDPETEYWTLAQRDKSTFYREHIEDEDADAKEKWKEYYGLISEKEGSVETYLFGKEGSKIESVSSLLQSIFTEDNLYNKCNKDEKQKILEAVRFILLPLQYLVKHVAFQEEQECRIMYITQFRDEKIHSNREEQKMYVEYEEPVLPRIDKIWLSPGAAKYQDFFRILLDQGSGKSKVRISQNPFRNKE